MLAIFQLGLPTPTSYASTLYSDAPVGVLDAVEEPVRLHVGDRGLGGEVTDQGGEDRLVLPAGRLRKSSGGLDRAGVDWCKAFWFCKLPVFISRMASTVSMGCEAAYKEGGEHERLAGVGLAVHHLIVHEVRLELPR